MTATPTPDHTGLYDRDLGRIFPDGLALLAGVDVETIFDFGAEVEDPLRSAMPAPLLDRMLTNTNRIDPDREHDVYYVIDRLAAEARHSTTTF